jgi:hypothetical protein
MPNQKCLRNKVRRMMIQQGGKCFFCGVEVFMREQVTKEYAKANRPRLATFDHIIPKKHGGTYAEENGVCACHYCNSIRGTLDFNVFRENVKKIHKWWRAGARKFAVQNGKLQICLTRNQKRIKRKINKGKHNKTQYAIAWFAIVNGKTVEDLFDEYVYNNTQELI